MTYSYKKIVSGYYLIKIKTEEFQISVRTKKPKELVDILLTYDVKLEEIKIKNQQNKPMKSPTFVRLFLLLFVIE